MTIHKWRKTLPRLLLGRKHQPLHLKCKDFFFLPSELCFLGAWTCSKTHNSHNPLEVKNYIGFGTWAWWNGCPQNYFYLHEWNPHLVINFKCVLSTRCFVCVVHSCLSSCKSHTFNLGKIKLRDKLHDGLFDTDKNTKQNIFSQILLFSRKMHCRAVKYSAYTCVCEIKREGWRIEAWKVYRNLLWVTVQLAIAQHGNNVNK